MSKGTGTYWLPSTGWAVSSAVSLVSDGGAAVVLLTRDYCALAAAFEATGVEVPWFSFTSWMSASQWLRSCCASSAGPCALTALADLTCVRSLTEPRPTRCFRVRLWLFGTGHRASQSARVPSLAVLVEATLSCDSEALRSSPLPVCCLVTKFQPRTAGA